MRKIYQIFVLSLVALMLFSVVGLENAEAQKYNWKFALEEIEGSVQHGWAQEFKKRIEEKSDGEVNIDIYPYGTLGSSGDISEQTINGVFILNS
jgi:TRAP-type C4-dicarboxylate transport system substrate-binding protein